jgi:hypothetical protein
MIAALLCCPIIGPYHRLSFEGYSYLQGRNKKRENLREMSPLREDKNLSSLFFFYLIA